MLPTAPNTPITSRDRVYRVRGAAKELFALLNPHAPAPLAPNGQPFEGAVEILLEGPAGTGKTTAVLLAICRMCDLFPGLRVLFLRQTRKSLSESVLRTLEELVLPPGSPVLTSSTASREHRSSYDWPNGSTIVCGTLDNVETYRSSEWDVIVLFEATELADPDVWQKLLRAMRATALPNLRRFMIADTNPDHPMHWLNLRAGAISMADAKMLRLKSSHRDNPLYFTDSGEMTAAGRAYLASLDAMSGHVRARYRDGVWVAAEGMIWPEWDHAVHVIDGQYLIDRDQFTHMHAKAKTTFRRGMWYVAGVDWGYYPGAGTILVGAVDDRGDIVIVHEEYRVRRDINEWVAKAQELRLKWPIAMFAADPAEPGFIDMFRRAGLPTVEANNDVNAGIDAVRRRLKGKDGKPRLYYAKQALAERDPVLAQEKRPIGLREEIVQYVYRPFKPGEPLREGPDPRSPDHACDGLRYLVMYADAHDLSGQRAGLKFPKGSYAETDKMPDWAWMYMPGFVRAGKGAKC